MLALIQRVKHAHVAIAGEVIGSIERGILALIGVEPEDTETTASKLSEKILHYRIFPDNDDKMNLSLMDVSGGLLVVPQFTLAADTQKGLRPSFTSAAPPKFANELFETMLVLLGKLHTEVASGRFGANMEVHLVNEGPVTFILKA